MQTGPRMQQREMQQVQNVVRMHCNAAYAECNLSRMYQNAIECIASNALRMHQRKCNVNAATATNATCQKCIRIQHNATDFECIAVEMHHECIRMHRKRENA